MLLLGWIGILSACGGGGGGGTLTIFSVDTILASLTVGSSDVVRTENGAKLTVTGDATVQGTVEAMDGPLHLRIQGNLVVDGTLRSLHSAPPDPDPDAAFRGLGSGIMVRVDGDATFGTGAVIRSNGPVVITDDDNEFDRTSRDAFDETNSASGALPTLVPLPPDDPAFIPQLASIRPRKLSQTLPPITIRGRWDLSGFPGDRPVMLFRFNGNRSLVLDGWTLIPPQAPPGANQDTSNNPGTNANGKDGKRGMNLNIWNNNGPIKIVKTVTLNLAPGGDGGAATAVCGNATGGDGGKPGNFRMTASGGIDLTKGQLVINPGRGGNGGAATVTKGAPGALGCPGAPGADATAIGGDGADNKKRIFVRGNVNGVANITVGALSAGDGGKATAHACDGGPGLPCCAGGPGGDATATGGDGGDASLNLGGFGIASAGGVNGGTGGDADATGGTGGDGGPCKFGDGGAGGVGGGATVFTGNGGDATASGGAAGPAGGNAGSSATATSGKGGDGGDSVFGTPGAGGASGVPDANSGGPGGPGGTPATPSTTDPGPGAAGKLIAPIFYCVPMAPFVALGSPIAPAVFPNHPLEDENGQPIGHLLVELLNEQGAQYLTNNTPADHLGIDGGAICFDLPSIQLNNGTPGPVTALQIVPLFGNGIDELNPMLVELLDAQGQVLQTFQVGQIPDNQLALTNPQTIDLDIGMVQGAVRICVRVPPSAFVTFLRIYLVDP